MATPKKKSEPYEWKKSTGLLLQWHLRDYGRWLFPQLGRKWEAEGVQDFTLPDEEEDKPPKIYKYPATKGIVLGRHLLHFADYVFEALEPYSDQSPYQWPRRKGWMKVPDLKKLHEHVQGLLKKKRDDA